MNMQITTLPVGGAAQTSADWLLSLRIRSEALVAELEDIGNEGAMGIEGGPCDREFIIEAELNSIALAIFRHTDLLHRSARPT